jgi:predicted nucleotidyltransferase
MSKRTLSNVTLLGIDCVNVERLAVAMDASEKGIQFGAVKLLTSLSTTDPRRIEIPHIATIEDFSRFCIADLHAYVDTDYVLLVQYDGFVLNPESWTEEFLHYDYIGAPWPVGTWKTDHFPKEWNGTWRVGNGGFSLRSKKFLDSSARLAQEGKIEKYNPEDVALCVWYRSLLEKEGMQFAPVDIAMRFSIESKTDEYGKPFGFHGLYHENVDVLIEKFPDFPVYIFLPHIRKNRVGKIQYAFEKVALEGHLLGSLARGTADYFSDVDVWFTFADEDFSTVSEKRFEYYEKVGEIVHICEPHQNAPVNGIFSTVLYKTKVGLIVVDYYLCPKSSSFATIESKKLFGDIVLPIGETELNPQQKILSDSYRIDFLICFAMNTIKKLFRKQENALEALYNEYNYLGERYGMVTPPLTNTDTTFLALEQVIKNMRSIANEKQIETLEEILHFAREVQK